MDELKQVLLIVGNGFDLNMELETSYNHFLKYLEENKLSKSEYIEFLIKKDK